MSSSPWISDFTTYAAMKIRTQADQIIRCALSLSTDELWRRSNDHTNSVANLILHLTGNLRQWLVGGVGGEQITRDRTAEFSSRTQVPASQLLPAFETVIARSIEIVQQAPEAELLRTRSIQNYSVTGLVAIFHAVEHLSFHAGQIVHITKLWKNCDLSLYDAAGQRLSNSAPRMP